jgi:hypothetical protein
MVPRCLNPAEILSKPSETINVVFVVRALQMGFRCFKGCTLGVALE